MHSLLGLLGGDWGQDFLYLGINDILYTHLGCFSAQGEQEEAGEHFCMRSRCLCSHLGRQCQLGLLLIFTPGLVGLGF